MAENRKSKVCPFCAENIKYEAVVCRYCHKNLPLETIGEKREDYVTPALATKKPTKKLLILFAGLALVMLVGIISSVQANENAAKLEAFANSIPTEEPVMDWAPAGFKYSVLDHRIAYKKNGSECDRVTCFPFHVYAQNGCPNGLYMEANLLINGVVEDWANDSLPSLAPMQKAKMKLAFSTETPGDLEWTKVSCR